MGGFAVTRWALVLDNGGQPGKKAEVRGGGPDAAIEFRLRPMSFLEGFRRDPIKNVWEPRGGGPAPGRWEGAAKGRRADPGARDVARSRSWPRDSGRVRH